MTRHPDSTTFLFKDLNIEPSNVDNDFVRYDWARLQCLNKVIKHYDLKRLIDSKAETFVNIEKRIFMYIDFGWAHYAEKIITLKTFDDELIYYGCGCEYVENNLKIKNIWE